MGDVYKAEDATLERTVALKTLRSDLLVRPDRLQRFIQEAKSVSALNHPHIVHVYDIGSAQAESDAEPIEYIAMEFVDGVTLGDLIHGQRLSLARLLTLMAQVADGMAKAHSAGIVHRDLKPDNILISADGYAKIVDFGVAKLLARDEPTPDATTQARSLTAEGVMLGTIGYMAPEQIEGRGVDHRADIFALGCILYEGVTRQRAFAGGSTLGTLQKILHERPRSVSALDPNAPAALVRLIERCLAKNPDERRQSMKDVALDLRDVHTGLRDDATFDTGRRRLAFAAAVAVAAVIAIGGAALFVKRSAPRATPVATRPERLPQFEKLTNTGVAESAAISHDGKYVVYVIREGLRRSMHLQHLATKSDVTIIPAEEAEGSLQYASFTRDGAYVYFTSPREDGVSILRRVPVLGGAITEVMHDVDGGVEFSPDGRQMVFVRGAANESYLMLANTDGTDAKRLVTVSRPAWIRPVRPAWSPDRNTIVFSTAPLPDTLMFFDVRTKAIRKVPTQLGFNGIDWLPDQSALIAAALKPGDLARQFWRIDAKTFAATTLTSGIDDYAGLSMSDAGDSLITTVKRMSGNLWMSRLTAASGDQQILGGSVVRGSGGVAFLPDGRVAYTSNENRTFHTHVSNVDGSNSKVLVESKDGAYQWPTVAGDLVAVQYWPAAASGGRIHLFDLKTGMRRPVPGLDEQTATWPQLSPDGSWLYFHTTGDGELWRIAVDGGEPQKVIASACANSAISPDGRSVACFHSGKVVVFDLQSGRMSKWTYKPPSLKIPIRWTRDGRALLLAEHRDGVSNVWRHPIDGGRPKQLTNFGSDNVWFFDLSRDGTMIVSSRGDQQSDAVLVTQLQ